VSRIASRPPSPTILIMFYFHETATSEIYTLSLHDALPISSGAVLSMLAMLAAVEAKWSLMFLWLVVALIVDGIDGPLARKFDVRSEEHTSELQSRENLVCRLLLEKKKQET